MGRLWGPILAVVAGGCLSRMAAVLLHLKGPLFAPLPAASTRPQRDLP